MEHLILSCRSSGILYPTEPLVQYVGIFWEIVLSNKLLLYHGQGNRFDLYQHTHTHTQPNQTNKYKTLPLLGWWKFEDF